MKNTYTILCVDDDEDILLLLRHCFSKTPYNVLTAQSGDQAVEMMGNNRCDIVLLDYKMPEKNGIEVLREIQKTHSDTDVLMLTAFSDTSLVVKAIKHGALDYILKPLDTDYLLVSVKKIFSSNNNLKKNTISEISPAFHL